MAWVRSEYAGELAVLSAWLAALLPWNVTYASTVEGLGGSVLFVRFPFAQIRYVFGVPLAERVTFSSAIGARDLVDGPVVLGYDIWLAGAAILALALALSVAMYLDEKRVEDVLPVDPPRLMGGLLGLAGIALVVATVILYQRAVFGGVPIPIGTLLVLVFAGLLLTVDRV